MDRCQPDNTRGEDNKKTMIQIVMALVLVAGMGVVFDAEAGDGTTGITMLVVR